MAKANKRNPFEVDESTSENSGGDILEGMYGGIPESGRIVAKPLPIMSIWPDPTQPRKILPREVHPGRTISPSQMPSIIGSWIDAIYDSGVDDIPIEDILLGKHRGSDKANSLSENKDPLVEPFVSLLWLAADIRDTGLKQAVSVVEVRKDEYRLVWGERRWTAYHLLKVFLGDKYANIPAQVTRASAWEIAKAQAAENFHKRQLTAIGIARQFAKLLILARQDTQDPPYDSWDALVVDGGCDRPYYAQVADGNIHRIPRGMGEEFERTLNISVEQMRQYRGLLRLTGDWDIDNLLWDMGDERDWAEGFMRSISDLGLPIVEQIFDEAEDPEEMFREAISAARSEKKAQIPLQIVTVSEDLTPEEVTPKNPFSGGTTGMGSSSTPEGGNKFSFGNEVLTEDGPGRIIQTTGNTHLVKLDSGFTKRYGDATLQVKQQSASWFNRYVQNPTGGVGLVVADLGDTCDVEYADGGRANLHKMYLSSVDKADYDAAVQRHKQSAIGGNWLNKFVRTFQGVAQVIRNVDGLQVQVQFPDGDKMFLPKQGLPFADKAEWDAAVAALENGDNDEGEQEEDDTPALKFSVGDRVRVAGMPNGSGTIRYIKPETYVPYGVYLDASKTTHYYTERELSLLGEGDRGLDNANSLPPANPPGNIVSFSQNASSERSEIKPRDWVGRPALWNEGKGYKINVFVQEFLGAGMLRVTSNSGRHDVHFSQLEEVETGDSRLSDFMNDDPDHNHSDLLGRRVKLTTGEIGTVTQVDGEKLVLSFSEFMTGGALVEHIVEVVDDEEAEETKIITDVNTLSLLRHIGHITRRENTILKLLALTRQNAIDSYKASQLVPDLQVIRDSIKAGFQELIEEVDEILEAIIEEAEDRANN